MHTDFTTLFGSLPAKPGPPGGLRKMVLAGGRAAARRPVANPRFP
jgi:hypothetical protein